MVEQILATQNAGFNGKLLLAVALDPKEIGKRIAAARTKKGWTQLEFATEHAHVSPSSVARWEAGNLPPVRELMRIADVLDVSADTLVEPPATDSGLAARVGRMEEQLADVRVVLGEIAQAVKVAPAKKRRAP